MQIYYITDHVALIMKCFLKVASQTMKKWNPQLDNDTSSISSGSPI